MLKRFGPSTLARIDTDSTTCPSMPTPYRWAMWFLPQSIQPNNSPLSRLVVEKCGNRTVRIFFDEPVASGSPSMVLLEGLVDLGCEY